MAVRQNDLLQGTLDLLVLRCLSSGPNHGYGIASRIHLLSDEVLRIERIALSIALPDGRAGPHRVRVGGDRKQPKGKVLPAHPEGPRRVGGRTRQLVSPFAGGRAGAARHSRRSLTCAFAHLACCAAPGVLHLVGARSRDGSGDGVSHRVDHARPGRIRDGRSRRQSSGAPALWPRTTTEGRGSRHSQRPHPRGLEPRRAAHGPRPPQESRVPQSPSC